MDRSLQLSLILPPLNHLIQHPFRHPRRLHSSRRTTIDSRMHDRLPDLNLRQSIVDRAADVNTQLKRAVQCRQHPDVEEATLLAVQPGAVPDVAPRPLGYHLLHWAGEVACAVEGTVDVLVAHDGPAGFEALGVEVFVCGHFESLRVGLDPRLDCGGNR